MDQENGYQCRETVNHFVFECTAYDEDRNTLLKNIKRRHFNFLDMMANTDYMKHLARYVNSTGRFKKTP